MFLKSPHTTSIAGLIGMLLLTACGSTIDSDVTVEVVDSVTYVRNGSRIDTTRFPYRLVLEQTFGAEDEPTEAILARIFNIAVGQDGEVYVLDGNARKLLAFNADGSLRWTIGGPGRGPGEFYHPQGMAIAGDSILLIGNDSRRIIDSWSLDGRYLRSRGLPESLGYVPTISTIDPKGRVVLASPDPETIAQNLWYFNVHSWEVEDSLRLIQELKRPIIPGYSISQPVSFSPDYFMVTDYDGRYRLEKFRYPGTLDRVITRDVDYLRGWGRSTLDNSGTMIPGSRLWPLPSLPDGGFIVHATWSIVGDMDEYARLSASGNAQSLERFVSLDAFDAAGIYIGSQQWNAGEYDIGIPQIVDKQGRLYTATAQPYPHVRRYRLELK